MAPSLIVTFEVHPCSNKRNIITMMVMIMMVMIIVVMIDNDRYA